QFSHRGCTSFVSFTAPEKVHPLSISNLNLHRRSYATYRSQESRLRAATAVSVRWRRPMQRPGGRSEGVSLSSIQDSGAHGFSRAQFSVRLDAASGLSNGCSFSLLLSGLEPGTTESGGLQ